MISIYLVAEAVEESSQKEFLEQHSCDVLQGYYFSRPISKEEFEALDSLE